MPKISNALKSLIPAHYKSNVMDRTFITPSKLIDKIFKPHSLWTLLELFISEVLLGVCGILSVIPLTVIIPVIITLFVNTDINSAYTCVHSKLKKVMTKSSLQKNYCNLKKESAEVLKKICYIIFRFKFYEFNILFTN